MIWVGMWFAAVAFEILVAVFLWRETGHWHPGTVRPDDQAVVRRLCMICWLLLLIVVNTGLGATQDLVRLLQHLMLGGGQ